MKYDFGDFIVNVIIKNKDNKNLYFRVNENMDLVVTCPKYMKEIDIRNFIKKDEMSLKKLYNQALKKQNLGGFKYLGKNYEIIFVPSLSKVGFKEDKVFIKNMDMLEDFSKAECMKVFTGEINLCRKCFSDLPQFSLKIRKMSTRWGVCNPRKKQVTLNSQLLHFDLWIIDYVIIHEMCHFYEANHKKHFWQLVEAACPRFKEAKKALKE